MHFRKIFLYSQIGCFLVMIGGVMWLEQAGHLKPQDFGYTLITSLSFSMLPALLISMFVWHFRHNRNNDDE